MIHQKLSFAHHRRTSFCRSTTILGLGFLILLLPAVALGYKVKTTEANVDWDPRNDPENASETVPIRWFEPEVGFKIAGDTLEGLRYDDYAKLVDQAAQIWTDTLRTSEAVDQNKACFPSLFNDGASANTTNVFSNTQDGENTVYFIKDLDVWTGERGYDSKALAMTNIFSNPVTGQIVEADIEINASAFNFKNPVESVEAETRRLGYTIEHEFGHFVGLGHSEVASSVMYATTTDDLVAFPLILDNDDVEGSCYLYRDVEIDVISEAVPATEGGCNVTQRAAPLAIPAFALLLSLCLLARWRRKNA